MDRTDLDVCVDVLGPLALRVDGRPTAVPGERRRALLALLALEGDRGLGAERLIDSLWPDDPPAHAVQALYNHVSRLRGHLGPHADRLERHASGYRLRLEPFELDADAAHRFAASDAPAALALWRGPALAEFRSLPELAVRCVALDELHLQLVDDVLDQRLTRGEPDLVGEAAAAAAASPLRERTALLLVRALAAEGRAAEAMAAAQEFRRRLVDETGLDPTPALGRLEQQVASGTARSAPARVTRPDGPMIGRQHDREEVLRLLGTQPVVTITGPGGVGKTRLALDIAADVPDAFVVPLAAVDRAERVCQAVASGLGLRTTGDTRPEHLAAALVDQEMLLVLDNCEHLVEACRELVAAVRRAAPGVRVLTTSRTTLQVPGEYVVRLQPLPLPRAADDLDALRRQPGVRAFVEHARRRRPDFELDVADAADLVEVLRRLDGLPLGIELAARQVAVMPVRAVRERLDRALDLATGREGAEDARQRTLRATIDSSYRLLGADEQRLLRALAPFHGGADLGTVEVLAATDAPDAPDPVDLLHRLVDASLVVADPESGRYRLLFTVRAFLADEVARRGEEAEVRDRFVARCRAVAEEIGARMFGPDEAAVDRRLRAELDNLRSARDLAADDDRVALTLAVNRVVPWRDLHEIWAWARELADDPRLSRHPLRIRILGAAAEAARLAGDFAAARRLADTAFEEAGPDDASELSRAWSVRAVVAHFEGDFAGARAAWLRAADGLADEVSSFIGSAALAAAYAGDPAEARALLDRARAVATCGSHRSFIEYVEGELLLRTSPGESVPHYLAAIEEAARVGCSFIEGVSRVSLASARAAAGDVAGAARDLEYLIGFWRRTGQTTQLWTTARNAAELLAAAGRTHPAALLLLAADAVPGAATVGEEIARFSGRAYTAVADLVDAAALEELRTEAARLGGAAVLERAEVELQELAGT